MITPRTIVVLLAALAACSPSADPPSAAPEEAPTTATAPAQAACPDRSDRTDVAYVANGDDLQRLDLHQPADSSCGPVPLVVWVHGGGWRTGSKAQGMAPKVALWNDAGWAVASIDYRLTDPEVPADERVVAPAHNQDVAAALAWLLDQATSLGIDPTRVALLGHSAGAGIVAAIAADPSYLGARGLEPTDLGCAAPLDTEGFDVPALIAGGGPTADLYRSVFGSDADRWADLSPLTHVGEAPMPDLFLVARGVVSRRDQVDRFATAVEAEGSQVTVADASGFSHADVNRRIGDPTDQVLTPALQEFLVDCLS